jgi:hypothetical protein
MKKSKSPKKIFTDYSDSELQNFRKQFSENVSKYKAELRKYSWLQPAFVVSMVFLFLMVYFNQSIGTIVALVLVGIFFCSYFFIFQFFIDEWIVCPACTKSINSRTGKFCPICRGSIKDKFLRPRRCDLCRTDLYSRRKRRGYYIMYKIHYCNECGILLDENGYE